MSLCCPIIVQAYGGYLATMLLSSEFPQLKCGTAVSPITDFELYGITFQIFIIINYLMLLSKGGQSFSLSFSSFRLQHLRFQNDTLAQRQTHEYIR